MKLINPVGKITCVNCFTQSHPSELPSRLIAADAPTEPDEILGQFLGEPSPPIAGVVVPPPRPGVWRRFVVDDRGDAESRKICPNCHMTFSHALASGQINSEIIAVVGRRIAGKSNYLGVLIHSLMRRLATEVGFTMHDLETFSMREGRAVSSNKLYKERYATRLYQNTPPMAIDQHQSAETDRELRVPLIYRLHFPTRAIDKLRGPFRPARAVDLVIFDAAGEDLADAAKLDQFCRYVSCASGIIFLVDPLQYPGARRQLSNDLQQRLKPIEVENADILSELINAFQTRGQLSIHKKIAVPMAFTFSKCDLFDKVLHPSSPLLRDSRHVGGFNVADHEQLAAEVRACIDQWGGDPLLKLAHKFQTHSFFGMSALGQMPNDQLQIKTICPRRVGDSLLWLLWQLGYIPAMKQ